MAQNVNPTSSRLHDQADKDAKSRSVSTSQIFDSDFPFVTILSQILRSSNTASVQETPDWTDDPHDVFRQSKQSIEGCL